MLTFIIEKIEQKPYAEVITERIINPIGLKNTYYGGAPDGVKNEAFSYKKSATWEREPDTDMSIPAGAGAIVSTPQDINNFLRNLFRGELVEKASLDKMITMVEGYGIGMFLIPFYDKTAFGHSGGIDGFQSMTSYFPEEDVAVSFTSNGLSMGMNELMIGILSIFFDKSYSLPTFSSPVNLTKKELDSYTGVYSSPTFPLKITISNDGKILIGQATGQPTFHLEALGEHKFEFRQAGLVLEFNPEEGGMVLKQGGGEFPLKRE